MPHMPHVSAPLRIRRLMIALVGVAAAVCLLLSMQGSAKAETCVGGKFCVYTGTFYTGTEWNVSCSAGTYIGAELLSAQNHCGVKVTIGWYDGVNTNYKACMAPGGLRPEPGRYNQIVPLGC